MGISPRLVALISVLALVPTGIYAFASGHLTPLTTGVGLVNLGLIVGSLVLLFSPSSHDSGHGAAH